ncbi:MAG: hypothetical protein WCK51_01055 [Armatimonadota bacterium]
MIVPILAAVAIQTTQALPPEWFVRDTEGRNCASCHSPSGFELRVLRPGSLLRRAKRHLADDEADRLNKGFRTFVPFEGITIPFQFDNEVAADDNEFLRMITRDEWVLGTKLNSIEAALDYQKRVLAISLFDQPVAFVLNLLSRDKFNNLKDATIADWIPDVPATDGSPVNLNTEEDYFYHDRAIAARPANSPIELLAQSKYRSLLAYGYYQQFKKHWMPEGNPMWKVGDFGRLYAEADFQSLGMSEQLIAENSGGPSPSEQMRDLRLSWFWLGWMFDPSLTHSGPSKETIRGDYFVLTLLQDAKLPAHALFMLTRKLAEQKSGKLPFEFQYSFLLTSENIAKWEPDKPEDKKRFRAYASQSFRLNLWLLLNDIKTTGRTIRKVPQLDQVERAAVYLKRIGVDESALISRVKNAVKNAKGV